MSRLFLHIGTPKTGTSAIQRFLEDNRAELEKQGYCFPRFPYSYNGIRSRRNGFFLNEWKKREKDERISGSMRFLEELSNEHDNLILTDEVLWRTFFRKGVFRQVIGWLETCGIRTEVIVYLRRQDLAVESVWNQSVKGRLLGRKTFEEYLEEKRYFPMDYEKGLKRLCECVGREHLHVKVYDRSAFSGGSILSDFLNEIGVEDSPEFVQSEGEENSRISLDGVEIKRIINEVSSYKDCENFYARILSDANLRGDDYAAGRKKETCFTPEKRKEFLAQFEKGNAAVAREYFGRKDGVLFNLETEDMITWQNEERALLMETIRAMAAGDVFLHNRIKELEKEVDQMYRSLPFRLYRKMRGMRDWKKEQE